MKNKNCLFIAYVISIIFSFNNLYAQIGGEVIYKTVLEKENFNEVNSKLIFKGSVSLFTFAYDIDESNTIHEVDHDLVDIENAGISFVIDKPISNYERVFIDREQNELLSTNYFFRNRDYRKCTVQESTGLFIWSITNNYKELGSFIVYEATTSFRGRDYKAWFTYDIPIDAGPWKFHGLPGLILEVTDEEMGVQFYATSVEVPAKIDFQIEAPDEGFSMTIEDFAKSKENVEEEFIDLIMSKLPRGVTASYSVNSSVDRSIEREF